MTAINPGADLAHQTASARRAAYDAYAAYFYYGSEAARATRRRRRGAGFLNSLVGALFLIAVLVVTLVVPVFIVAGAGEILASR
jgi:hypothetical protein